MNFLFIISSYRDSFLKFYSSKHHWEDSTIYLYFFLVILVYVLSRNIGGNKLHNSNKSQKSYILLVGTILVSFLGLRGDYVGTDTATYIDHFVNAKNAETFFGSTLEYGFRILLYALRSIIEYPQSIIIVCSFITIFYLLKSLWENRYSVNVAMSLLIFMCLYFFQSMNIMRIYMVAAIMMYGTKYLLEHKFVKYSLLILLCCTIHYSVFVLFVPLGMYLLYRNNRRLALFVAFIAIVGIVPLLSFIEMFLSIERYMNYFKENEATGQIGIMLVIDYLPCLYVTYSILKDNKRGKMEDLMVCFTFVAFIIKMSSYFVAIAGRLSAHFMVLTCFFLPYFLYQYKKEKSPSYNVLFYLTLVWAVFRLHFYFGNYLVADGIMPYYFFWKN